jgi:ATP-binding cassette subfamily F protein uup
VVAGGYEDWVAKRKEGAAAKTPRAERTRDSAPSRNAAVPSQRTKLSYKDQRDYELLPARIEDLDKAISDGERALSDPDLFLRDPKRFAAVNDELARVRAEKDAAEERWLELAELVEGQTAN